MLPAIVRYVPLVAHRFDSGASEAVEPFGPRPATVDALGVSPERVHVAPVAAGVRLDRVEVAQVPTAFMIFTEGTIFQDNWGICWEVISFNTTGVETYSIFDWFGVPKPGINTYQDCRDCRGIQLPIPCGFYEVRECGSETTIIVMLTFAPTIGLFYSLFDGNLITCYEIIGYASPIFGELYPSFNYKAGPFTTCEEC